MGQLRDAVYEPGTNAVLVGPGGAGKTSLAIAALRAITAAHPTLRVVHVTASDSLRGVPLGAFEPVLGELDRESLGETPDKVGRAVIAACMAEHAPGYGSTSAKANQLIVHVDDSPDLDELSVAVVDYLISRTDVRVVVTCRQTPGPSSTLVRAIRDEVLTRIDVPNLTLTESVDFASSCVPDKPLAPDSLRRMHEVTGGNALFLSELLRTLEATDGLAQRQGLWVWASPLPVGTSLGDLLRTEFERLDADRRNAFEIAALTAPVSIELLLPVASATALAELADAGWLTMTESTTTQVTLTQPLYGESMTSLLSSTRVTAILSDLYDAAVARYASTSSLDPETVLSEASAVESVWRGEAADLVATVGWGLRANRVVAIDLLTAAFRLGHTLGDYSYRIRISSALLRHPDATPVLRATALINRAEAHRFSGSPDLVREDTARSRAILDTLPAGDVRSALAAVLAIIASDALVLMEGRWEEALEILDWAESIATGSDAERARLTARLDASRGIYLAYGGRMPDAGALAERLHREAKGSSRFLPLASTLIIMLGQRGESRRARGLARAQMTHAVTSMSEHPLAAGEIVGAWCLADMFMGHQREASFIYGLMNAGAARNPGHVQLRKTLVAFGRGLLAVVSADWPEAVEHLTIACSELDDFTGTGSEGLLLASLSLALAANGDPVGAAVLRERLRSWPNGTSRLLELPSDYFVLLGSLYAPDGSEPAEARRLVAKAQDFGFDLMELRCLHALAVSGATLTADELARIEHLAQTNGAPIAAPLRDNCIEISQGASPVAGDAARRLARRGLMVPTPQHSALTMREHQLAELFALGYSNAQIAKKLTVSKRTIESHAAHIFQKLHVSSREDVGEALSRRDNDL